MGLRRSRLAPLFALLCALAVGVPASARAQERGELRAVLRRRSASDARTPAELVTALSALGPAAVPGLYGLVTGQDLDDFVGAEWQPSEWLCTPEDIPSLCAAALERAPTTAVLEVLEAALEGEPTLQERLVLLRILGAKASADGLALVLRAARELGDMELERPSVRRALREALSSILRRDARAFAQVEMALDELEPYLCAVLVEAIGACGRARGMAVLEELFRREDLDPAHVSEHMAELELAVPWQLSGRTLARCRSWLDGQDPAARARGITLAGRLHALELVPALIEFVAEEDPLAQRCALEALRTMARVPLEADAAALSAWFEREQAWKEERWAALFETLRDAPPGEANEALRDFARHPLYRHAAARELSQGLGEFPPTLGTAACATLERLESRWALPGLLEALADTSPPLRAAAWRALRKLTGQELELSLEHWRDVVGS